MTRALLVIDMQNGCFEGEPPRQSRAEVCERINRLAAQIRKNGTVIFVQHDDANEGLGHGSFGWEILPELILKSSDLTVEKTACDAFLETNLDSLLKARSIEEVVICGCATDFCVDTTVRTAAAKGYDVWVAADAHTTRDRPHLGCRQIIEHHHFMWRELLLPNRRVIKVEPAENLLARIASE